jgi:hypothetical protein
VQRPSFSLAALKGVPFISPRFESGLLVAAVVAARTYEARRQDADHGGEDPLSWLLPHRALSLWRAHPPLPESRVSYGQAAAIRHELAILGDNIPEWRPLLVLPVEYRLLPPAHTSISASAAFWPQHVLLSPSAFETPEELREQVV